MAASVWTGWLSGAGQESPALTDEDYKYASCKLLRYDKGMWVWLQVSARPVIIPDFHRFAITRLSLPLLPCAFLISALG